MTAALVKKPTPEVLANIARSQLLRVRIRKPDTRARFNVIRGVDQLWTRRTAAREAACFRWSR